MEPGATHTLTHLPEESQITEQYSCPKGPGVGMGVRDLGESGGGGEEKKERGDWNSSLQEEPQV